MGRLLSRLGLKTKNNNEIEEETGNPTFWKGNETVNFFRWFCYVCSELLLIGSVSYAIIHCGEPDQLLNLVFGAVIIYMMMFLPSGLMAMHALGKTQKYYPATFFILCYSTFIIADIFLFYVCVEKAPLVWLLCPFLMILQYFAIVFPSDYILYDYTPARETDDRFRQVNAYEEREKAEKSLSVKESGPFKIVIKNEGEMEHDRFLIMRAEDTDENGDLTRCYLHKIVKLNQPLRKGESVVLIPEVHNEPGAYKIAKHLSFGPYKSFKIETLIYLPRKKGSSTFIKGSCFTEEFELPGRTKRVKKNETFIEQREFN